MSKLNQKARAKKILKTTREREALLEAEGQVGASPGEILKYLHHTEGIPDNIKQNYKSVGQTGGPSNSSIKRRISEICKDARE